MMQCFDRMQLIVRTENRLSEHEHRHLSRIPLTRKASEVTVGFLSAESIVGSGLGTPMLP